MTAPKAGDRVRVTVEGEVREGVVHGTFVVQDTNPGLILVSHAGLTAGTVEVLAPPEPEWQRGDVVLREGYGTTSTATCLGGDRWSVVYESDVSFAHPACTVFGSDLTIIPVVRGGKVVTP